jgi:hypothetical protein
MLEIRDLMRIFGPNKMYVIGILRTFRNEELHNVYSYPKTVTVVNLRTVRGPGQMINPYKSLDGKYDWRTPLRTPCCGFEDNVLINLFKHSG